MKYWFEAKVKSKYVVWVGSIVFITTSLAKIYLIIIKAPLLYFVWVLLIESALSSIGYIIIFYWVGGVSDQLKFKVDRARALIHDSWPLMLSGLAVMLYMRIDQIMVAEILSDEMAGVYSAAIRVSEVWYFIPIAIVNSVFPSVIMAKKKDEKLYYDKLQKLYNVMVMISIGFALPMSFIADSLIILLYGSAYSLAGSVLLIHIWAGVFTSLGVASGRWYLIEPQSTGIFYRTALGATANVFLNLWLIPLMGIAGAAWATLISYSVAGFWFDILRVKTRRSFFMKLNSITFGYIYAR